MVSAMGERLQAATSRKMRFTSNVVASLVLVVDILCIALSAWITTELYKFTIGQQYDQKLHLTVALIIGVNFLLIRLSRDSYGAPLGKGKYSDRGGVFEFLIASMLVVATVWQLGLATLFARGLALGFVTITMGTLFFSRFFIRLLIAKLVQKGFIGQRVALYGADERTSERVLRLLELERLPHLTIVGIADGRKTRTAVAGPHGTPFIGDTQQLIRRVREGDIDLVIIALPNISQQRLDELLDILQEVSVDVCLMPREALDLTTQYSMRYIGTLPLFALWQRPMRDWDYLLKAIEDKLIAAVAIVALSPILIGAAIAVRLSSPGPILFKQRRFGFNNVEIEVLKFRSMYVDRQDVSGAARTTKNDSRVTGVGRFIRRTSIDELPQLLNVLRGDMSIVGPRPHATSMKVGDTYYFDAVRGYAARHRVKPGITGLAQVRGLRGEIDTIERAKARVDYDRYYIDNWTITLDIRIILETVYKLFWDRHAY